jgi:hypothetical protein
LTLDHINELVLEAGVTDIGVEPKAVGVPTFQRVTGAADTELVGRYLETAWQAVECVAAAYAGRIFLGVGTAYNRELAGLDEVEAFGRWLVRVDPEVQLCVLDHFPTFRRRALRRPHPSEVLKVKRILEETGLHSRLEREDAGLQFVERQVKEVEAERTEAIRTSDDPSVQKVRRLLRPRGIGANSAWLFVMEFSGWRAFRNRRQWGDWPD